MIERGLTAALGSVPGPNLVETVLTSFDRCYRQRLFTDSRLFPGVLDTLASLRAAGLVLGCVTNKREAYAIPLLDAAGISPYLNFIHGGDTFNARKPDPTSLRRACEAAGVDAAAAVMVGDSFNDRDAARAAGSAFIFAAYGYVPDDDSGLRQDFGVIENFAELEALLCGE